MSPRRAVQEPDLGGGPGHSWSRAVLTSLQGPLGCMVWGRNKRDKLKVGWGRTGLGLDPSHKHRIWKLEGPFCLESRGQLSSVCFCSLCPQGDMMVAARRTGRVAWPELCP